MLFATHVNIAAFRQEVQSQRSEHNKTYNQFPHDDLFQKKSPRQKGEGLG